MCKKVGLKTTSKTDKEDAKLRSGFLWKTVPYTDYNGQQSHNNACQYQPITAPTTFHLL